MCLNHSPNNHPLVQAPEPSHTPALTTVGSYVTGNVKRYCYCYHGEIPSVTLLARVFPHLPDNDNTLSGNGTLLRSENTPGYHNLFSVDLRVVCNFCAAATIQTASSTPARSVGSCALTDRRFLAKDRNQHHHSDV
ncbi:hypothetical protein PSTG_05975 [Puccinia striiformis f. sp. tritici PST-78]|uniref:Uncharacterized protein n=1 Tax=Puccinia striiformis f. sp. tritici PST-78 TaxID=1165861 RepID=A0A0L0VNK4_9BASI|nr:hypothetical protein PSTG_05975 [Puccinia striiformis f. sp. tritici PST-78]